MMEKTSMDKIKFDSLHEILPGRESWRIKVRVLRMWKVPGFINPSEPNSMEMVLVDEKGGKIHATIRRQLLYMFDGKIEEGSVYQMSFFSVCPATGYYRSTLHPYKLLFQVKTRVKLAPGSEISTYGLSLLKLSEVLAHTHDYEFLVDVIGLMTGMSAEREYMRDGRITKMVLIELTDDSGKCECALFGDYVDSLKKMMGKSGEGLPVVVIQFAKVKLFRDKVSLQNVLDTTRVFVDPDIPEAQEFKNSLSLHGIDNSGAYYCNSCAKHIFQVVPRFKVKVHVSDGKTTCVFVLFDADMSYIMEKSCAHFVAAAKADKDGSFPLEFDSMVVCMDSTIIEKFCAEGPFVTPLKPIPTINLDDDSDVFVDSSDESDVVDDSEDSDFTSNLIVTPKSVGKEPCVSKEDDVDDVVITAEIKIEESPPKGRGCKRNFKRNLTKAFDAAAPKSAIPLKAVKIEKE
ncbi:hypothetical protein P8452_01744 [Trifolium repens]|nr:hypothetical protein P8452_01744 [Trifolium repens]